MVTFALHNWGKQCTKHSSEYITLHRYHTSFFLQVLNKCVLHFGLCYNFDKSWNLNTLQGIHFWILGMMLLKRRQPCSEGWTGETGPSRLCKVIGQARVWNEALSDYSGGAQTAKDERHFSWRHFTLLGAGSMPRLPLSKLLP